MTDINIVDREVLEVIRDNYNTIFPAEQKVASFVLENPNKAVNCNVSELAKASGVSDATIIRMCHHLGYSGYYQFRLALSRDIGKTIQPVKTQPGLPNDVIRHTFEGYAQRAVSIGKLLDLDVMRECVNLIKNAGIVHLVAAGNTTNVAKYTSFRLERLGIRSICSELPEYFMNHINLSDEHDIVLAISKSGSSRNVIEGMRLAKDKCLKRILITSCENSPAGRLADYILDSSGKQEPQNYYKGYSYLNEFMIVEALLNFVVNEELIKEKKADRPEFLLAESKF